VFFYDSSKAILHITARLLYGVHIHWTRSHSPKAVADAKIARSTFHDVRNCWRPSGESMGRVWVHGGL